VKLTGMAVSYTLLLFFLEEYKYKMNEPKARKERPKWKKEEDSPFKAIA